MSDFEELKRSELWIKGRELGASIVRFDTVLCKSDQELYAQTQDMLKYVIMAHIEGVAEIKLNMYYNAVAECRSIIDVLNNWAADNFNSFDIVAPLIFRLNDYIDIIKIAVKKVQRRALSA